MTVTDSDDWAAFRRQMDEALQSRRDYVRRLQRSLDVRIAITLTCGLLLGLTIGLYPSKSDQPTAREIALDMTGNLDAPE